MGKWTVLCVNSSGISVWFEKDACLDYMGQTCPSYFDILSKNFSDMLDLKPGLGCKNLPVSNEETAVERTNKI